MFQFQIEALRDAPIADVFDRYLQDLRHRGYSPQSIYAYTSIFRRFLSWCDRQGIETAKGLSEQTMTTYRSHLTNRINTKSPKPLRPSTRVCHLSALGGAFAWMRSQGIIDIDPMAEVQLSSLR